MIAAHLIVGEREEPILPALLKSLEPFTDVLLVNDNARTDDGVNAEVLARSTFALEGRMHVDRSPFVDFADARNRVLALHRAHAPTAWAAFVDADDVHRPLATTIARNLDRVPAGVNRIDAYTRHYIQSFAWYTSIERRLCFFRVTPESVWINPVHERLTQGGGAIAIPYVYDHYGWVLPLERQAEKGRQYASLGQAGTIYSADAAKTLDPDDYFGSFWPRALRYRGSHAAATDEVRRRLGTRDAAQYAHADAAIARVQSLRTRLTNIARNFNFSYRWRGRMLDPRARALVTRRP